MDVEALSPLGPDDPLARFTVDRKAIGTDERDPPRVKTTVLSPQQEVSGRWALSTFRVDGLTDAQRRAFGQAWADRFQGGRDLKAYCALAVRLFESAHDGQLRAEFDDDPRRHVNVVGWPDDEPTQLAIALDLCWLVETEGQRVRY